MSLVIVSIRLTVFCISSCSMISLDSESQNKLAAVAIPGVAGPCLCTDNREMSETRWVRRAVESIVFSHLCWTTHGGSLASFDACKLISAAKRI